VPQPPLGDSATLILLPEALEGNNKNALESRWWLRVPQTPLGNSDTLILLPEALEGNNI
jgi:hypothetical protein